MPVALFYKDKSISLSVSKDIINELANLTKQMLSAKIEVRVFEPIQSYNANEIHIEVRFRDISDWSDTLLEKYHREVMLGIERVLKANNLKCAYSFYIIPTAANRSMWKQNKL